MKENAPEKLYVDTDDVLNDSILYGFTEKRKDDDIEYIRKDVFTEKVMKYIANHFLVPGMDNEIKDFANYMEEE